MTSMNEDSVKRLKRDIVRAKLKDELPGIVPNDITLRELQFAEDIPIQYDESGVRISRKRDINGFIYGTTDIKTYTFGATSALDQITDIVMELIFDDYENCE